MVSVVPCKVMLMVYEYEYAALRAATLLPFPPRDIFRFVRIIISLTALNIQKVVPVFTAKVISPKKISIKNSESQNKK